MRQKNGSSPGEEFSGQQAYEEFVSSLRMEDVAAMLSGDLDTGVNACVECCDRHAQSNRVALYWEGEAGDSSAHTFRELQAESARFANLLRSQGVGPGDRVACLLPRIPELFAAALGIWRAGAVYVPLFTAFGPKAIEFRLGQCEARLVVTDTGQRSKLDGVADCPPVVVVSRSREPVPDDSIDFQGELKRHSSEFSPVMLTGKDPFMLLFTSGTTGAPKGVAIPIGGLLSFLVYMKYAVGLRENDAYWNVADPGWAYGLWFAIAGPLAMGCATHFYEGPFTAESTYSMLSKYGITRLAAAPTAYRMLMAAGTPEDLDLRLRNACSAGEPLNPEVIHWLKENLGCRVLDHYGQTEIGMVVCNHHALEHPVIAGSMGLSMPGFRMVALDDEGREVGAGQTGQLALDRSASALHWFQGYLNQDTGSRYSGPYYLTGDWVEVGAGGHFTFVGRRDDIITTAGYRVGPFDVESTLIEHPAVAESAVVGLPDPERGEKVAAFVVLQTGQEASPGLEDELRRFVGTRLSAHAYPRHIQFVESLPKTPSGKIQRFLLRREAAGE